MIPCLLGCTLYAIMVLNGCNDFISLIFGVLTIIILRTLATIFKWNLPSARGYDELFVKRESQSNDINK